MEYILLLIGFILIVNFSDVLVDASSSIANSFKIPKIVIALTIVAFGTSAPELAISMNSMVAGNTEMVLGNIIGSNIFNILMVIGLSSVILPLPVYDGVIVDGVMDIVAAALVYLFVMTNKQHEIKRWHGIVLLMIYAGYLAFRITSIL